MAEELRFAMRLSLLNGRINWWRMKSEYTRYEWALLGENGDGI